MRILLTNDDGIMAPGIKTMESILTSKGHEVWVIAPERQRSASSHAIHIEQNISIKKISERHYSCSGFPADCILFFSKGAFSVPGGIDLVISGINEGYNLGTDIIYSATCGAATEAALRGYKSIAVSSGHIGPDYCYKEAAEFVCENLEMLLARVKKDTFVNVNVPPKSEGKWRETTLGVIDYHDELAREEGTDNFMLLSSKGPEVVGKDKEKTDFYCARKDGVISVSTVNIYPSTVRLS